jgi:hypothetical protein
MRTWASQELDFPLITKLARALLTLPYTSAEVESTFSKFKVIKSPYRNRLSTANLEASLLSEQFFGVKEFEILPEMYSQYANMGKPKKKQVITVNKTSSEVQCDLDQNPLPEKQETEATIPSSLTNTVEIIKQLLQSPIPMPNANEETMLKRKATSDFQTILNEEPFKRIKLAVDTLSMVGSLSGAEKKITLSFANEALKDNSADNASKVDSPNEAQRSSE